MSLMWDRKKGRKFEKKTGSYLEHYCTPMGYMDLLTFKEWLAFFAVVPVLVVIKIMSPIVTKSHSIANIYLTFLTI